jgi:hypothetical protein
MMLIVSCKTCVVSDFSRDWEQWAEPFTFFVSPRLSAEHTELCAATASHVVTTRFEFDDFFALIARLPSLLFFEVENFFSCRVLGAFGRCVPLLATLCANFGLACGARSLMSASGRVQFDEIGSDPGTALGFGTVDWVNGRPLVVMELPRSDELSVEQLGHVVNFDWICNAALWWHDLAVTHGEFEQFLDAGVAHPVLALEMCGIRRWHVGKQARHTSDAKKSMSVI